jgi:four helix bundle protein
LRSWTAPAAHHGQAHGAESPANFVHKLRIAVKELNESEVWLRIIIASNMLPRKQLAPLIDECNQLQRILSASIKTARKSASR